MKAQRATERLMDRLETENAELRKDNAGRPRDEHGPAC
jgi:hypothetical protein